MIFGFHCRWSILLTFTDLMAVANAAFQRCRDFGKTRSIPSNHNDNQKHWFSGAGCNLAYLSGLSSLSNQPEASDFSGSTLT
jgi:hypothetical protein